MREYLNYLVRHNNINNLEPPTPELLKNNHIKSANLPNYINPNRILKFDQNFECGNIDSVFLHRDNTYNLQMKVDTNTKGNTYWFLFRVTNFQIGQKYTFNIFNFTRSLDKFYKSGMNVLTRAEDLMDPDATSEWRYKTCTNVHFSDSFVQAESNNER